MQEKQKKVLLVKLSSLGDVIFNIPLANSLKKSGYEVDWLVSEKGTDVLVGNPCLDNVIVVPFKMWKTNKLKFLLEYIKILKKIRSANYDVAIDTQGRLKSLIFTIFSGIKRRLIGTDFQEFSNLGANEFVGVPKKNEQIMNIVDKYLMFAKHLGISCDNADMTLPEFDEDTKKTATNLLNFQENKPIVVISPTTTWDTKHWDKENWKELVAKIKDNHNLVFTGTEKDIDYIDYIRDGIGLNLAGKTSLKVLIEIFRRAKLVISLDSGSTHLARACRANAIVSIFCSTPSVVYEPIGEKYISLQGKLACQPCHKRKCPNGNSACTKLPTVDEVYKAVNNLLN